MTRQIIQRPAKHVSAESYERIRDFLSAHQVGVLSTVDPSGNPHGAVIYYSADDDLAITFNTKFETQKHVNIKNNPSVMLVVYEADTQTTVQIIGTAEDISGTLLADVSYKDMVESADSFSIEGIPPIAKLAAGKYVPYRIRLKQIRMAVYSRPDKGGYEMFETLDFED